MQATAKWVRHFNHTEGGFDHVKMVGNRVVMGTTHIIDAVCVKRRNGGWRSYYLCNGLTESAMNHKTLKEAKERFQ